MIRILLSTLALSCLITQSALAASVRLSSLDLSLMSCGYQTPQAGKSITGKPLRIGDKTFEDGVGTHAESEFLIQLDGKAEQFIAQVGVDAAAGNAKASVEFVVYGDEKELYRSGRCKLGEAPRACEVPLKGVATLTLLVTDCDDGVHFDHADWADARITYKGAAPKAIAAPPEEEIILTPPAPAAPRINGARVFGVRPGSPFIYRIPATGVRPMTFAADGLTAELNLDTKTGIITGRFAGPGEHEISLIARNAEGQDRRNIRIMVGDKLALTPPMGWNHWYTHYNAVSDQTIRRAADVMISSGMADYGYQYVNIDDCWMVKPDATDPELGGEPRDAAGRIRPNKRFPDMKALTDYIHAYGLRAGIYTSPGPRTCGGYEGAYQHEAQDVRTFAEWGFDFLKYDWCSYRQVAGGDSREQLMKPYKLVWDELQKLDRDIIFNLCQYGMGNVWEWGAQVGHCWRTTGDLGIVGGRLSKGIYKVGLFNAELSQFAGPGHWNDPDYLLVGWTGNAHGMGKTRAIPLTPNEQYTHMSMWSLMAAPLFFSGDMSKLEPFTLNILCNSEVIEVDQDPLGQQARVVSRTPDTLILAKDMQDGSKAVGLFNLGRIRSRITIDWARLGLTGPHRTRDLWRQKDIGVLTDSYSADIPRHGVMLIRLWPAK